MSNKRSDPLGDNIDWFRQASPYIRSMRDATLVISATDAALHQLHDALLSDVALLNQLGIRVVLVHGIRDQLDVALQAQRIQSSFHEGRRVTPAEALPSLTAVIGRERIAVEAALSASTSGLQTVRTNVVSGNYITAKPYGIHDGVDYQQTGLVRRVDAMAIHAQLDRGAVVLLSPVGYSPSGELFNLRHEDLATEVAVALRADKLIQLLPKRDIQPLSRSAVFEISPQETDDFIRRRKRLVEPLRVALSSAADACRRGVRRSHILDAELDGSLFRELFSRDGCGTMVTADGYDGLRRASADDLPGLESLIRPLEVRGALVPRAREQLEQELENYTVIERDGLIVACAAMFKHDKSCELACLATHEDYRNAGHAEQLLSHLQQQAKLAKAEVIFVLTTQT
ncbi:MAG: amino-acid N-acetyltransferase, partial [Granulosicoccaceae bacterium]